MKKHAKYADCSKLHSNKVIDRFDNQFITVTHLVTLVFVGFIFVFSFYMIQKKHNVHTVCMHFLYKYIWSVNIRLE